MESFLIAIASLITKIVLEIGYFGIFGLMALESSFIPFPSEIVIPPAAYLSSQGQFNLFLVILAGIGGSLLGALINYYLALSLGRKVIYGLANSRIAKFLLINQDKLNQAEKYFLKYGNISTFIGRLVVGVRQLISIPAGFCRMKMKSFLLYTSLGSGIWVIILAWLGYFFGANQERMEAYYQEIKWGLLILGLILFIFFFIKKRKKQI